MGCSFIEQLKHSVRPKSNGGKEGIKMTVRTTSLETSKLLKDGGFRQDTEFYLLPDWVGGDGEIRTNTPTDLAAPTTEELLEEISNEGICKYALDVLWNEEKSMLYAIMNMLRDPNKLANCWLWLKSPKT